MPTRSFAFEPGGPPRLTLSWGMFWRNFTVSVDGVRVGGIESSAALKAGEAFTLPDGSRLEIRLDQGFGKADLLVLRDGQPLPGSAGDPVAQVNGVAGILFFIAGLNVVLGIVAIAIDSSFLTNLGLGIPSMCMGIFYAGLAFAVRRWRSRVALGLAMALFAIDGLATIALAVSEGGTPPTGGIIFRVFLLIAMGRAFPALGQLQAIEAARGKPGLPGGDDPNNPYQVTPS